MRGLQVSVEGPAEQTLPLPAVLLLRPLLAHLLKAAV